MHKTYTNLYTTVECVGISNHQKSFEITQTRLYPTHRIFEPCSHLNRFEIKTQTTNLTWFIPN
jgi:hypothetical protein